jgi:hypothetical protein
MNNKASVSIVLPIKSSKSKDFAEYFDKAIKSIQNQQVGVEELVIVHTSEESLINYLTEYDFGSLNVSKLLWDKSPSYSEQVNMVLKMLKVLGFHYLNLMMNILQFGLKMLKSILRHILKFKCSFLLL